MTVTCGALSTTSVNPTHYTMLTRRARSTAPVHYYFISFDGRMFSVLRRDFQEEERRLRSYDSLFDESKMASNTEVAATEDASASVAFEDDFMVRKLAWLPASLDPISSVGSSGG